jgi:hypothetical protein
MVLAGVRGTPGGGRRVELALRRGLSVDAGDRFPNMGALIDAIAPPRRSWWKLLAAVGAGLVVAAVLLTQCFPVHGGGSSEFVANAHARCSGELAVLAAQEGDVDGALRRLEDAKRVQLDEESSQTLSISSGAVAAEFERQALYQDAAFAWQLAILFARDGNDIELEQRSRERFAAAADAI